MYLDPDARMTLYGPEGLADYELLAYLLTRGGAPGPAALGTARALLVAAGSLPAVLRMGEPALLRVKGLGPGRIRRLRALLTLARRLAERPIPRGETIREPRQVYEAYRGRLGKAEEERMVVFLLDGRSRKLGEHEVARGRSNAVFVSAKDVFRAAVREGASAVILAHNHPSGDASPSAEDVALTAEMVELGDKLGVRVLDHLIITDGGYCSLAREGLIEGIGAWPEDGSRPRRG